MLPAEILLISQTRSPSRSPPKAKTNGKSGQQAAQKRTPWKGGRKRMIFFVNIILKCIRHLTILSPSKF